MLNIASNSTKLSRHLNTPNLYYTLSNPNIIIHNRCSKDPLQQTTKTLLTMSIRTTSLSIPKSRDYEDWKSATTCILTNKLHTI